MCPRAAARRGLKKIRNYLFSDLRAAGNPHPTNGQVREHLGGSSQFHISPVMWEFRARQGALVCEQSPTLPPELALLLTGQLALLWQDAVKQANSVTGGARAADDGITQTAQVRGETQEEVAITVISLHEIPQYNWKAPTGQNGSQRGQFGVKFPLTIPDTDQPSSMCILQCHKHIY